MLSDKQVQNIKSGNGMPIIPFDRASLHELVGELCGIIREQENCIAMYKLLTFNELKTKKK